MTPPFKPADVILCSPAPFVGTYSKAEVEVAAGLLVHTLAERGNEWRGVSIDEMLDVIRVDFDAGNQPWKSLSTNPWLKPDFIALVDRGLATWQGEPGKSPLAFTDAAYEPMYRWSVSRAYRRIMEELRGERGAAESLAAEREAEYAGKLDELWKRMNDEQQRSMEREFAEARTTVPS